MAGHGVASTTFAPTLAYDVPQTAHIRRQQAVTTLTYPLTTVFTRPTSCEEAILTLTDGTPLWNDLGTSQGVTTVLRFGGDACYPPQFYSAYGYSALYSPGACPSGMRAVVSTVLIDSDVTMAKCCVPGATIGDYAPDHCGRPTLSSATLDNDGERTVSTGGFVIYEPAVKIAWASSDLPMFDPPSAPILGQADLITATQASITTSVETSAENTRTQSASGTYSSVATQQQDGGLSSGAKTGLGVGVAVGALLIIGLLVWALLQRRMLKRRSAAQTHAISGPHWSVDASMTPQDAYQPYIDPKYDERPYVEMSADRRRAELQGSHP